MPNGDHTGPAGPGSRTGRCQDRGVHRGFRRNGRPRGINGRGLARRGQPLNARPDGNPILLEEMEALRMQVAALGRQIAEKKD